MKVRPFVIDNSHLFWKQEKWDGYNGKWMDHVRRVLYEITRQRNELKEEASRYTTMNQALMYFSIIQNERINMKKQLESNKKLEMFLNSVKSMKPKKLKSRFLASIEINNRFGDLVSESETENEESDLYDKADIEKLSEYIHKVIMASLSGHALQAMKEFWFLKISNGFETVSRVIDVFGQKPEQSLLTPFTYEWSKIPDPRQDWGAVQPPNGWGQIFNRPSIS